MCHWDCALWTPDRQCSRFNNERGGGTRRYYISYNNALGSRPDKHGSRSNNERNGGTGGNEANRETDAILLG